MKIAITKSDNFPFGLSVTETDSGIVASWLDSTGVVAFSATLNEQFIRERCGQRELDDCSNIYLEVDGDKPGVIYVHNKMAATLLTKNGGLAHLKKTQRLCLGQIYIPFADSPVSEWVFRMNCSTSGNNELPKDYIAVANTEAAFVALPLTVWPQIRILATTKLDDERTQVSVQLTLNGEDLKRAGVRIFATSATGYISKREVLTDENGQAKLIARRLDLEPEDAGMLVEFGFKFLKNVTNVQL